MKEYILADSHKATISAARGRSVVRWVHFYISFFSQDGSRYFV